MPVRIRLARFGKKKVPFFRIVVIDGRKKRDGAYLDTLGTYDALKSTLVTPLNVEKLDKWLSNGAIPTDSVKKIIYQYKKSEAALAA